MRIKDWHKCDLFSVSAAHNAQASKRVLFVMIESFSQFSSNDVLPSPSEYLQQQGNELLEQTLVTNIPKLPHVSRYNVELHFHMAFRRNPDGCTWRSCEFKIRAARGSYLLGLHRRRGI